MTSGKTNEQVEQLVAELNRYFSGKDYDSPGRREDFSVSLQKAANLVGGRFGFSVNMYTTPFSVISVTCTDSRKKVFSFGYRGKQLFSVKVKTRKVGARTVVDSVCLYDEQEQHMKDISGYYRY